MTFTGAFASRASRAAITTWTSVPSLLPKPPPMYSVMTRAFGRGIFSASATPSRDALIPCVETYIVSLSPSHSAMPPWVSSDVCVWTWVE